MEWELWHTLYIELTFIANVLLTMGTLAWVLMTKKDATSALAWCLLILFLFFLPFAGPLFFWMFGYQHVHRPLRRKLRHKRKFHKTNPPRNRAATAGEPAASEPDPTWEGMAKLAERFGAFPVTPGNQVDFYYEGQPAFAAMFQAIAAARHHIHIETFIFQPDDVGRKTIALLAQKVHEGVEVRLLYDAMGSRRLNRATLRPLVEAGGKCSVFLPLNLLRRRFQINMRDHRKITVIDGRIAFTGGLNIGDEYLSQVPRFGFWRDTHLRLQGPAVAALARIFAEDWDFAAEENLHGDAYFPDAELVEVRVPERTPEVAQACVPADDFVPCSAPLASPVQVIQSGPDQEMKSIREIYFAAMQRARRRLWIASPYFVPDAALLDALCLAAYTGVDVRLLCQYHPDKWIPFFAGRFYWAAVLNAGVKVYQYKKGMMHAKTVLVDGEWASVGTANLDNRSLHLNFEVNCLIYSPEAVAELEAAFQRDLVASIRLNKHVFAQRPVAGRLMENACRLMSPVL